MRQTTVARLFDDNLERLRLRHICGSLETRISVSEDRIWPADMVGHLNLIHPDRLQILGSSELAWARRQTREKVIHHIRDILSYGPPAIIIADSEAFTLWASPLVPLASVCYALTAGVMLALTIGWSALGAKQQELLATLAWIMPVVDLLVVVGILLFAKGKSKGGAFSVEMLLHGEYAGRFRNFVLILGFVVPVVLVVAAGGARLVIMLATAAMLIGFCTFRILMFKAAVFEPISHDLAGSIGLPAAR